MKSARAVPVPRVTRGSPLIFIVSLCCEGGAWYLLYSPGKKALPGDYLDKQKIICYNPDRLVALRIRYTANPGVR